MATNFGRIVSGVALLGLGGLAGWGLGQWRMAHPSADGHAAAPAASAPASERKVLYWYDPMMPTQRFDKPGKSPFMEMQLVPRYADEGEAVAGGAGTLTVSTQAQQALGLRLATVQRQTIGAAIEAVGTVELNDRDISIVQTRSAGFVERVYARAPGDVVAAGAPLVDLLVPEWLGAQQEYLAVKATGDAALTQAARSRLMLLGMPAALIERAERSGQAIALYTITAPSGGVITELIVRQGMSVATGMTLARINGVTTVWLEAALPESLGATIRPGQAVEARFPALPGEVVKGKVAAVLPEVNRDTRTLRLRIELPNPGQRLKAGLFAQVSLRGSTREALVVPAEAVIRTGKRALVYVWEQPGRYRPVEVEIGEQVDELIVVRSGLSAGQQVVASGQFLVDSEASLQGVLARGAPHAASAVVYRSTGVVVEIEADTLTLEHAAVPELQWPAMTMPFKLRDKALVKGLKKGQSVSFSFDKQGDDYRVTGIAPLASPQCHGWSTAMIAWLIRWSVANRFLVLLATVFLTAAGLWGLRSTPVDALPDLSDVQVIVRTSFPGQAPQIVENQVTYPLATTMMSVPGAKTVRGFSFFGDSFVYVLFEDGTDLYWARSRVLEYLNQVQARLPASAKAALGPDATGVGWIFQYVLVDRSGRNDLSQLRALQDWFLKYELKSLPDVAEVASVGGMVRQYQVVLHPNKLVAYGITHAQVRDALLAGNQETGGSVLEMAEAEYMVRASGYLKTLDDFRAISLGARGGIAVRLGDVATVQVGPEMRRGIAELDGQGEVAGGVIILRSGKNAQTTIQAVKTRLAELQKSLPQGVEIVTTYDRSALIERAVVNLSYKLLEEFLVVAAVCVLFLWHLRSALVAIIALPLGVLSAFLVMRYQGINANIMSLGGIAIAIGAMVDAAVVMIENAHKKIEAWRRAYPGHKLEGEAHWKVVTDAAVEVGPALFFSLLIITLSFIPVFTLQAQEGRLFGPLAFTKTYAMAAAAGLSVTLIPVLMGYWIRGRIPDEQRNPITRGLIKAYQPALDRVLKWPKATVGIALLALATTAWPLLQLGGEFLPTIDEGDLLYMPSALPGLSAQKAGELLQLTNRMIKTVPEVERVFGKAGRAETATDPAPLEMFETTIQLKAREQWRPGMTPERLVEELDRAVQVPGLSNLWVPPIRNRIDMLATGIKSPIGVKVSGADLAAIDRVASLIEQVAKGVPGVSSALGERLTGGRYVDVVIDRVAAARYGLNIADVQALVAGAIGGENVTEIIEGRARFPVNLRYPREYRDTPQRLATLPMLTPMGQQITLGTVATVSIGDGPPMLKSENARPSGWVFVDVRGRDLASVAGDLRSAVAEQVPLEPGISVAYSGQFEYLERANARLTVVVPATLLIIFVLLYLTFSRFDEALLIMATLPFALIGGVWLLYLMGYALSVATVVGFIALAGVAAEFGVVMLLYLKHALRDRLVAGAVASREVVDNAIREGAVQRVRPKAMTVAVILAGLVPIVWGTGTGSEVMSRIAAPMLGGMVTAPLLSLFVVPAVYALLRQRAPSTP